MLTNLDILLSRIKDAEYAHLLLEPLPLFGLLFGLIFFAVGLYMGQDKCRVAALIVIACSCASVIPYSNYRNKAMPRILQTVEIGRPMTLARSPSTRSTSDAPSPWTA